MAYAAAKRKENRKKITIIMLTLDDDTTSMYDVTIDNSINRGIIDITANFKTASISLPP